MKRQLNARPKRHLVIGLLLIWLLTVAAAVGFNPFWMSVAITTLLWVYLCLSWNIVGGILGQVSFGHAAFFGIGAYASTALASKLGVSPWFGMLVGGAIAAAAAWVVGYFPFRWRLSHLVFALMTLAFGSALQFGVSGVPALGGNNGLFVAVRGQSFWDFRFSNPASFLLVIAIMTTVVLVLSYVLYISRTGLLWRSLRDNEDAAASIGVRGFRAKQTAFAISAFLTSLAGTFYAQYVGFIDPLSVFGVGVTVEILLFAVVGGAGTLIGPVIGPMLLVPVSEGLRVLLAGVAGDGVNHLLFGAMLMLVIRVWPGGIAGVLARRDTIADATPAKMPLAEKLNPLPTTEANAGQVILKAQSLRKVFGGLAAVDDVSLELRRGEILGVIGPNGAGKTTLFTMLAGFQRASAGTIHFSGPSIESLDAPDICRLGIARTFQLPQLFETFTVLEAVLAGSLLRRDTDDAIQHAVQIVERMGLVANKVCSTLTLADRRRLEIARALATSPQVLLLDEVLAGLTPKEVADALLLIASIREQGVSVILIEHNMKAVMRVCDRIVVLDLGKNIAVGRPAEVTRDPRVVAAYLGTGGKGKTENIESDQKAVSDA